MGGEESGRGFNPLLDNHAPFLLTEKKLGSEADCGRVSVQGVKSLGGHFACLCREFEFYEVKNFILLLFFKKKMEILLHF